MESPLIALFQLTNAFKSLGIKYVVVGSVASSVHGDYRASADVDVVAAISEKQIRSLVNTLSDHYLRTWAERVGVSDLLERALNETR